jgi:hypothetical protein
MGEAAVVTRRRVWFVSAQGLLTTVAFGVALVMLLMPVGLGGSESGEVYTCERIPLATLWRAPRPRMVDPDSSVSPQQQTYLQEAWTDRVATCERQERFRLAVAGSLLVISVLSAATLVGVARSRDALRELWRWG